MTSGRMLILVGMLTLACFAQIPAAELVTVRGSKTRFTASMETTVDGKPVKMSLTGAALRQKYLLNIYCLASYLQEGVSVHSAEELVAADCVKQLHLVMERTVSGKDLADSFVEAIRRNYPAPALSDEVNQLAELLRTEPLRQGDHLYLTHLPGTGLRITMSDRSDLVLHSPELSKAIWSIYLGPNNLGESIKKGLLSRP